MLEGLEAARLPRPSYVARAELPRAVPPPSSPPPPPPPSQLEPLAKSSDTITNFTAQKALNNLISQESITTFAPASLGAALARSRAAQTMGVAPAAAPANAPAPASASVSTSASISPRLGTPRRSNSDSVTAYDALPPPPSPPSPRSSRVLATPQKAHSTTVADPYARTQASPSLLDDLDHDHDHDHEHDHEDALAFDGGLADELEPLALDSSELEEIDPLHALSYPSHDDLVSMEQGELARTDEKPQYVEPSAPIDYDALRRYLFEEEEEAEKPTQAREMSSRMNANVAAGGDDEKPTQAREMSPAAGPSSRLGSRMGSSFEIPPPPSSQKRRSRPDGAALSAEEGRTPVASLLPKLAQMQRVMEERQRLSMLPPHERFPAMHTPHAFLPPHPQMPAHDHTYAMNGTAMSGGMSGGMNGAMNGGMMPIADRTFTYGTNPSNAPSNVGSGSSSLAPESWAESPWIVPATPRPSSQVPTERTRKETDGDGAFFGFNLPWPPQVAALVIGSATLLMIGIVVVVAVFVRTATASAPAPTFSNPAPTAPMVLPTAAPTVPPAAPSSNTAPPASVVIAPPVAEPPPPPVAVAAPTPATSASTTPKTTSTPAAAPRKITTTNAPRDISPNQGAAAAAKKKPESKGPKSLEDILSELGEEQVKR
jgi:hypothetical protein